MGLTAGRPIDLVARGTMLRAGDQEQLPITIKTRGQDETRVEIGTTITITNGENGTVTKNGLSRRLPNHSAIAAQITMFPLFAHSLAIGTNADASLEGTETVDASTAYKLDLKRRPESSDPEGYIRSRVASPTLWIETSSGLVVQIAEETPADDNPTAFVRYIRKFSDYRQVAALKLPFREDVYLGTQLLYSVQLEAIDLNSGLADSDFQLATISQDGGR